MRGGRFHDYCCLYPNRATAGGHTSVDIVQCGSGNDYVEYGGAMDDNDVIADNCETVVVVWWVRTRSCAPWR
jgi:hypothetical protein